MIKQYSYVDAFLLYTSFRVGECEEWYRPWNTFLVSKLLGIFIWVNNWRRTKKILNPLGGKSKT